MHLFASNLAQEVLLLQADQIRKLLFEEVHVRILTVFLGVSFAISTLAAENKDFSLEVSGKEVCKVPVSEDNKFEKVCHPRSDLPEIKVVEMARKALYNWHSDQDVGFNNRVALEPFNIFDGDLSFMNEDRSSETLVLARIRQIIKDFKYLRIKHVGISRGETSSDGETTYQFVMKLLWQSNYGFNFPNGTLSVDGSFVIQYPFDDEENLIQYKGSRSSSVDEFSDSHDVLGSLQAWIEMKARHFHFDSVSSTEGSDQAAKDTSDLLKYYIAPIFTYKFMMHEIRKLKGYKCTSVHCI